MAYVVGVVGYYLIEYFLAEYVVWQFIAYVALAVVVGYMQQKELEAELLKDGWSYQRMVRVPAGATRILYGEVRVSGIVTFLDTVWGNNYLVTLKKEGYINKTISIKKTLSGWAWGNILFGGIIGLTIDGITGAADDLHNVSVRLISDDRWDLMMRERMSEP